MSKNTKVNGKPQLNKHPIHRSITVGEFLKRIKKDPNSSYEDFRVKYAIEKLQQSCLSDNRELKDNAKHILQKARLEAYIPKGSRSTLRKYKNNPERLIREVDILITGLKENLPQRVRTEEQIIKAIQLLKRFKWPLLFISTEKGTCQAGDDIEIPVEKLKKWVEEESLPNSKPKVRDIAFYIIAYNNYVPPNTLRHLYDDCKKSVKESIEPISENSDKSFLNSYNQAYNDYLIREHKTHEYHEMAKRLQEALLPFKNTMTEFNKAIQETLKPLKEMSKTIDESMKPLREIFSKINI